MWSPDGAQMVAILDGQLAVPPGRARWRRRLARRAGCRPSSRKSPSWTRDSRHVLYQTDTGFRLVDVVAGSDREIVPRLTWTAKASTTRTTVHAGRLFDGRTDARERGHRHRRYADRAVEAHRDRSPRRHRRRCLERHRAARVDRKPRASVAGVRRAVRPHLAGVRHHDGAQSCRRRLRGTAGARIVRRRARIGTAQSSRPASLSTARASTIRAAPRSMADRRSRGTRPRADVSDTTSSRPTCACPTLLQRRVIDEAHRLGLPVTSHEIYPAVAYGADGVEHIAGTSRRGFSPKISELRRSYRDVIDLLSAVGHDADADDRHPGRLSSG